MIDRLVSELEAERASFLAALADVDAELATVPGVMEDWSVRDLVVHVAAWAEHAVEALDLVAAGRGAEFGYSTADTDRMNAEHLVVARATPPAAALEREATAFAALRDRVAALDPEILSQRLGNGDSVEEVIRYDGPEHYAEHTAHLRAWFAEDDDDAGDDADAE